MIYAYIHLHRSIKLQYLHVEHTFLKYIYMYIHVKSLTPLNSLRMLLLCRSPLHTRVMSSLFGRARVGSAPARTGIATGFAAVAINH